MDTRRIGKYAYLELERCYLLSDLPPSIHADDEYWLIEDRYIIGTRLRVRRMTASSGNTVLHKLGQKFRVHDQDATQTTMTNIYLDEQEYARLQILPARLLFKRRYRHEAAGRRYSIDVFAGHLRGLVLGETECETVEEVAMLPFPAFAFKDVTDEPFFTGGNLVAIDEGEFQNHLAQWLAGETNP